MTPDRLRELIAQTGHDRRELATIMGYKSEASLRQCENGKAKMKKDMAEWLERYAAFMVTMHAEGDQWHKDNPRTWPELPEKPKPEGSHTDEDVERIAEQQGFRCAYCRVSVKVKRHKDHIIARARGGSNWPSNLQILCPSCNLKKWAHDPIEFAKSLGNLL